MDPLVQALRHAFINNNHFGSQYDPKLIINQPEKKEFLLTTLQEELENCQSFTFSVAFITESGLNTLKTLLADLHRQGISGRLLTSTYLDFNQPDVFDALLRIPNLEVRMSDKKAFHAKGYLFEHTGHQAFIIGSSNLTINALKTNYEWNIKLTSYEQGEIIRQMQDHLDEQWASASPLTPQWIARYRSTYQPTSYQQITQLQDPVEAFIKPNRMQQPALDSLQELRAAGETKGLVIAATGTGKTYLAAFDVRQFAPKRMLFVVHREQILASAMASFKKIFANEDDSQFGLYTGNHKDTEAKFLFATQQTLTRDRHLHQFDPSEFDYIIIDEVHRAGSESYQRILNYFTPDFLLGLTATPDRTDGYNIYDLFDYNIAYEIRLQDALEENLLAPFHYFGVTDYEKDGEIIDDTSDLAQLVLDERVDFLIERLNYYGLAHKKVKGLIFCSRRDEAISLSEKFNQRGFKTVALSGSDSQEVRKHAVRGLQHGVLDYIFTVDIFNEGIDIPEINQVVMLRQTQSSIIFIQQMGRGLRKHESKDFVNIIDFIGNYNNNYMIPAALSGDTSRNKDNLRRNTMDTTFISGLSSINFEQIAKERIFKSINTAKMNSAVVLKNAYVQLKERLNRVPLLVDFQTSQIFDPLFIAGKHKNYPQFIAKQGDMVIAWSARTDKMLNFLTEEVLPGKRVHEIVLIKHLHDHHIDAMTFDKVRNLFMKHQYVADEETITSVLKILSTDHYAGGDKDRFEAGKIISLTDSGIQISDGFRDAQKNETFQIHLNDLLMTAKILSEQYDHQTQLTLYQKYSRREALRFLNWHKQVVAQNIGGYVLDKERKIFVIFVTIDKGEDFTGAVVAYEDTFPDNTTMHWFSTVGRTMNSPDIKVMRTPEEWDFHMFVQKTRDDKDFYYLGQVTPDINTIEEMTKDVGNGKQKPLVQMNLKFHQPIDHKLFRYLK
jgi:superfamily II DNA or RNA helicase